MDRIGLCVSLFETDPNGRFSSSVVETLAAQGMEPHLVQSADASDREALSGLSGIITDNFNFKTDLLHELDGMRAVGYLASGTDLVPARTLRPADIACLHAPSAFAGGVAQAALTLMLATAGRVTERQTLMRASAEGWRKAAAMPGTSLHGKTLGILGPGAIGQALFELVAPFGCRKLACGARERPEVAQAYGFTYVSLAELCKRSDVLVLACPLNGHTRGVIGADMLGLMKQSAILVNVARGPVVDEKALIAALAENRIAGAGLDVFEQEPTPLDNPLLALQNVVATPHGLAVTNEGYLRALDEVATGIRAVLNGDRPKNLVS